MANSVGKRVLISSLASIQMLVTVSCLSATEYGREMAVRAHQNICWYEYLKALPNTSSDKFGNCYIQAPGVLKQIVEQNLDNKYFGEWMMQLAMDQLPKHYLECESFLKDSQKEPKMDRSENIRESTTKYPFRGFVHCLVDELKSAHGDKALADLKKRVTQRDHWKVVLLERENEFRQIHGSGELKLVKQLSTQAQMWADKIAKECDPRHSKGGDPDRQFQSKTTGESLAMASADTIPAEDAALVAANGWYEEIQDYPFPEGYSGDGSDELFPKIGHFTQQIWKGSEYVGYGYAVNKECPGFKSYVVARYYPAGNLIGTFKENVTPPQ